MNYPVITPEYYMALVENREENKGLSYSVLVSPAAVEYVFPMKHRRVVQTIMDISTPLSFKMAQVKPEDIAVYEEQGKKLIKENPILAHYWNIKSITMLILQNRKYSITERMLILNYAYDLCQRMIDTDGGKQIAEFTKDVAGIADLSDVVEKFEKVPANLAYSLMDGLSFLRGLPQTDEWDAVIKKAFDNLGVAFDADTFKFDSELYTKMKKEYEEFYIQNNAHYMEQVLVNLVWSYCMPCVDVKMSFWDNYIFFNVLANAVKVLITCYTYGNDDKKQAFEDAIVAMFGAMDKVQGGIARKVAGINKEKKTNHNGDMAMLAKS